MAWVVHYWDESNNRNISSSEISTQEDAMQKACNLMQQGHVVSHVAGPNGERIDKGRQRAGARYGHGDLDRHSVR